nr:hypothetical protein [Anaeroplasmataceae bacterium]
TIKSPEKIEKIGLNKRGQKRYELSTYFGESSRSRNRHLYFTIVIDQIDSQTFEIVTAYPKPRK